MCGCVGVCGWVGRWVGGRMECVVVICGWCLDLEH